MEKVFLTQEELGRIQEMNSDFNKSKMAIGELEMNKYNLMNHVEELKMQFAQQEQMLIAKYGIDSVVNMQTGEVTQKTK
jgi:hypothetical protein